MWMGGDPQGFAVQVGTEEPTSWHQGGTRLKGLRDLWLAEVATVLALACSRGNPARASR